MTSVIETIEAPRMSVRIVSLKYFNEFALQYEYAREGRAKLYGGFEKQQWKNVCYNGYAGKEGPKVYTTIAKAKAAAKRFLQNNN